MTSLNCPKCGAPRHLEDKYCLYCGVGFEPLQASSPSSSSKQAQPLLPIPDQWVRHTDRWNGFTVAHPPGWEVVFNKGLISVREDPAGLTSAWIYPLRLSAPMPARAVASQYVYQLQMNESSYQAWLEPEDPSHPEQVTIRTQAIKDQRPVTGRFNVWVDGCNALIQGFECPVELSASRGPLVPQILSSFQIVEPLPRQPLTDPTEGAFTASVLQGWSYQAAIDRNHIGNSGMPRLSTGREPQGLVAAHLYWFTWSFLDGPGSFLAPMAGAQALRFMPAAQFSQGWLLKWMKQYQPNLQLTATTDRPDLARAYQAESGLPPGSLETYVTVVTSAVVEAGVALKQKATVFTQRMRNTPNMMMMGMSGQWMGGLISSYRAPDAEFAEWEPVLTGIIDSVQMNPQWKQMERMRAQNYIAQGQQEIQQRTRQISQTLSETSDIITSGYWQRQATYDRTSQAWSNAMLGRQDMVDSSGSVYNLPTGYDQYWRDNLGRFYGGDWFTKPDIGWEPLKPTGV